MLSLLAFVGGFLYRTVRSSPFPGEPGFVPPDTVEWAEPGLESRVASNALEPGPPQPEVGEVTDADEGTDLWAVLDGRAGRIHVLHAGGQVTAFGRLGEGPGELWGPGRIAVVGDDLVVADWTGSRLDRFTLSGEWLGRVSLASSDCPEGFVRDVLADPTGGVLILRSCARTDGKVGAHVEAVGADGGIRTLLHVIYSDLTAAEVDPLRAPLLATGGGTLILGITGERCVTRFDRGGRPLDVLCHPELEPPPLPDSVVRSLRALASRRSPAGPSLRLPERYPVFRDLAAEADDVLLLRDLKDGLLAVERAPLEGPTRRLLLPAVDDIYLGVHSVLIHTAELEGARFAVVSHGRGEAP